MKKSTLSTEEKLHRVFTTICGSVILLLFSCIALKFITGIQFFAMVGVAVMLLFFGSFILVGILFLLVLGFELVYYGITGKKKFDLF